MKLSFIIPVYNGSAYIIRCLESIYGLSLPLDDFEVIVADDCSTDDTCSVVEEYIKAHSQVRLLKQSENHRQGAARNRGLREANGDYISFIDADDLVLDGVVPAMRWAETTKAEMVYCSYYHENSLKEFVLHEIDLQECKVVSGRHFCEQYQAQGVFWYPWSFLYRRDWLVELNYPFVEDRQHEDRDWVAYVLSQADSVINSKKPMYRYVCNPSSTCHAARYSTVFDHTASGIRHIKLSHQLQKDCPNLSQTLYSFGVDEIYKSLRLRNLTKYKWSDNKHLYDEKHLYPLLNDLRQVCKSEKLPFPAWLVAFCQPLEMLILAIASPIASIGRRVVASIRKNK